jgi:hypothetical protein
MKRLLVLLTFCLATVAQAQHRHFHHHHHYGSDWRWLAPAIIGGAVVYAATRPPVVVSPPQPVFTTPSSDVVYIDGMPYRKQLVLINGYYQEVLVRM